MTDDRPAVIQPRVTHCAATWPAHPDRPCTEWVNEYEKQARAVAGGGAVAGRIADGGLTAARAVSDRAAESIRGAHRCCRVNDHVDRFNTPHLCGCRFGWSDPAADLP